MDMNDNKDEMVCRNATRKVNSSTMEVCCFSAKWIEVIDDLLAPNHRNKQMVHPWAHRFRFRTGPGQQQEIFRDIENQGRQLRPGKYLKKRPSQRRWLRYA
jgi:hypothetical protein